MQEKNQKKIKLPAEGGEFWLGTCLEGHMLLRPYKSWYTDILRIKMYLGRGVSHTPSERFQRKRRDTPRHKNDLSPSPAAFVRRMQYAPTYPGTLIFQKLVRTRVGRKSIRPPNVSEGNEETRQGTKTISRRLRLRLGGRMQYAPIYLGTLIF